MTITIKTTTTNGHLILYIIDSSGLTLLTLRDTDTNSIMLVPGYTYRFEWHVWSPFASDYTIEATVSPPNPGFLPFMPPPYQYPDSHRDMGGFYFSV